VAHRFLDHTGEVAVLIEAASEEAVFAEMLEAFSALVARDHEGTPGRRTVEISAADRPSLLVEWTNELVYLAEVDGFMPERVEELVLGPGALRATIAGRLDAAPANLVKAATFSGLEFEKAGDGWRAQVVLDV
jgi:SHS2 domain-containing protein